MEHTDYAALTRLLGLTVNDLAEIGDFSDRYARDLFAGKAKFPEDVRNALHDLDDDSDVIFDEIIADVQEGDGKVYIFKRNDDLRQYFPDWPGRGHALGGFVGPHRIAAMAAVKHLRSEGVSVDLRMWGEKK